MIRSSTQPFPDMPSRFDHRPVLLIISQTFVPDPASVGQHMADVAVEMARRGRQGGYRVVVYASARGYEDPTRVYPLRENLAGVEVRRLPFASFGKKSLLLRVLGTFCFQFQALLAGLLTPNVKAVFFSTSPPLIGVVAVIIHILRGAPLAYWAMDLNPDQLIALGKLKASGPLARFLEATNRLVLRESALIVALDRFMADRLRARCRIRGELLVMPPWPHEDQIEPVDRAANPFRLCHGLTDKFVIMYSGNHSPSNPLATLLQAAAQLQGDERFLFAFVGGGAGKKEVDTAIAGGLGNAISLPYQPMSELRNSLTAADVHVVSLGDAMVGVIHPCKIYGAMAAGRPIFFLGPRPSHISDILDAHPIGVSIAHGDVAGAVAALRRLSGMPREQLDGMGQLAREVLQRELSQERLRGRFCDALGLLLATRADRAPENPAAARRRGAGFEAD
jgi:colanic acid biosynthesis glycosyl transferase WcaI